MGNSIKEIYEDKVTVKVGEEYNTKKRQQISQIELFQKGIDIQDDYIVYDSKKGGMGYIGLCKNKIDNEYYVLKTYQYKGYNQIFKEEIEFALKLEKNPYIVYSQTVLKDEKENRVYLVMELVGKKPKNEKEEWKSVTLTQELQKGIEKEEGYKWAIEFCRGMQYLNSIGMKAHQDIKPDNIFITESRDIKIADYGFATLKEKNRSDKKGGTVEYYSPEHYVDKESCDIRSDIYSFGIVLYEIFNAGINIERKTEQISRLKRKKNVIDISQIKSKHCNEIIKKCLQTRQEDRYQDFKELEKDILKESKKELKNYIFTELIVSKTNNIDFFYKANGYFVIEEYKKAIDYYNKIIKTEKRNILLVLSSYYNRGLINSKIKKEKNAVKDYNNVINYCISFFENYKILSELNPYYKINANDEKEKFLKLYRSSYNNRGIAKLNLGLYEEAYKDFCELRKIYPGYTGVFNLFCYYYLCLKDIKKAKQNLNKVLKKEPKNPVYIDTLGDIYKYIKEYDKAIEQYEKAISINKNQTQSYYNLIEIYKILGKEKKVKEIEEKLNKIKKND